MKLSENTSRELFAAARSACLGTVDAADAPHLVPITFAVDADRVYFAVDAKPKSSPHLKRLDNIRRHSAVCLLADHYDADWTRLWWVRADGVARILTEEEDRAAPIRLLIAKYPQYEQPPPQGPVVEIEVARWSGWAFSEAATSP
ncbi:TIGR03668 family PPOX class F420-dependent oxidoreductase [Actinospica robiniae]|uniref:TIGR03668 family PPOX class F420-dependent oxidoreductase n=1 Tax=Actinospica robiniae TaxID=304901 RepID=UPI0004105311|nr:TIGR03668 family PPOX class F420-dependent oxidoreductase [Actinospica robiniae]